MTIMTTKPTNPDITAYTNPEFSAYGRKRVLWLEDWRDHYANAEDAHDATTRPRVIDHTGWYIDNFQHETTCGVVLTIKPLTDEDELEYLAGVRDPWNEHAVLVDLDDTYTDVDEAARAADSFAERYADDCRTDDMKAQAEMQIEDAHERIRENRKAHSKLIKEHAALAKQAATSGAVFEAVCATAAGYRLEVRDAVARIKLLRDEPWRAVE
jgi:hypothetical protein